MLPTFRCPHSRLVNHSLIFSYLLILNAWIPGYTALSPSARSVPFHSLDAASMAIINSCDCLCNDRIYIFNCRLGHPAMPHSAVTAWKGLYMIYSQLVIANLKFNIAHPYYEINFLLRSIFIYYSSVNRYPEKSYLYTL